MKLSQCWWVMLWSGLSASVGYADDAKEVQATSALVAVPTTSEVSSVKAGSTISEQVKNFTGAVIYLEHRESSFQVTLPENPSTGFRCYLTEYDQVLLEPISSAYSIEKKGTTNAAVPEETIKTLIGAPGSRTFTFQVKPGFYNAPQKTKIEFRYYRPWSSDDKGKKKTIVVYSA